MSHISRRTLLGAAASIPAAGVLAACSGEEEPAAASGPPDEVTYMTAFGLFGREAYAHVAVAKGFFAEENLEVTIEQGAGGPPNHQALVGGAAQFASVDSSGAFERHATGQADLVVISAVQQLPLMAIITLEGNGITSPQDLAGKVIGGSEGSVIESMFPAYADLSGFDASTVTFEHVAPPQLPAILAGGQVDAIGLFLVGSPAVEAAADGRAAIVLPYDEVMYDLYGAVHVCTRELAEQNPDLVRRFNTAILRGLEYAIENPEESGEILAESVPEANPAVAASELTIMAPYVRGQLAPAAPTGTIDEAKAARALALLQSIGFVEQGGLETVIDSHLAWEIIPSQEDSQ